MIISPFIGKVFNQMILLRSFAAPLDLEWPFSQCNAFVTFCHTSSRCNISQPALFSVNTGIRRQWYRSLDGTTSLCTPGIMQHPEKALDTRTQALWIPVTQKTQPQTTKLYEVTHSKTNFEKFRISPRQKEVLWSESPKRLHIKLTQDYCRQHGRWLLSLSSLPSIHPFIWIQNDFATELLLNLYLSLKCHSRSSEPHYQLDRRPVPKCKQQPLGQHCLLK